MRRRTFAALGAGVSVGAATCALLTTAVVGSSLAMLAAPPFAPPAAAEELEQFDSCEQLRQWYVDAALPLVGPWGLGWSGGQLLVGTEAGARSDPAWARTDPTATPAAGPDQAVGNGATGTNLQEAGVDEPDVAKTDGRLVAHLTRRALVLTDVTGDRPRELSRTPLPRRLVNPELLLAENTVLVTAGDGYADVRGPVLGRFAMPYGGLASTTRLVTFDISDPTAPAVTHQDRIEGHLLSARESGGTVRAVVANGGPVLDFVHPTGHRTAQQARRENRRIVRTAPVDTWLPRIDSGNGERALVACTDVRHPRQQSGLGTISVLTFDANRPGDRRTTAVTAAGELVYSSADRLYVATSSGGWTEPVPLVRGTVRRPAPPRTQVHAFAITGPSTEYVASGEVPGSVRDRWSFSEYDGHLRVATALGPDPWTPRENAVVVLDERDGALVQIGRVGAMGPGEQIQSVRWFGDLAVVVTFRQTDPLYTVDLSDPAAPRVVGELKIRGFSSYLHPIGGGRLLGLGQDATAQGVTRGAQAAVFDLSDPTRPRRLSTSGFGPHTELAAARDSRAFTYLPERQAALTAVQDYRRGGTRLAVLTVHPDGTLTQTLTGRVAGWDSGRVRALPLGGDRVALVAADTVRLLPVG